MVRVFWNQQSISITLPLLIAITALARFIILQGKEMDPAALVYEAYVSEQNLLMDDSDEPIKHPLIEEIFSGKKGSSYFKPSN